MKYFVFSDVHGFYDELIKALARAGYNKNDPCHKLISCGDAFDRGKKPREVMDFLMENDAICIRGNHEDLLEECCLRQAPYSHDISNGTWETILRFGSPDLTMQETKEYRRKCLDYYETEKYIFTHGWIPLTIYGLREQKFEYNPDWRDCLKKEWKDARWINGIEAARNGFIEPNKIIVCGHWHASYGHSIKEGIAEWGPYACFEPYYDEGILAIDACTAYSGKVNVVVIDE